MEPDNPEFAANLINNYIRFFDLVTKKMLVSAKLIPFRVGSGISNTCTVEAHRQKMMAKVNVENMTMLVSLSVTHKLVTTD